MTSIIEQKKLTGPTSYSNALVVIRIYGGSTNFSANLIYLTMGSQHPGPLNSTMPLSTGFEYAITIRINTRFNSIKIKSNKYDWYK